MGFFSNKATSLRHFLACVSRDARGQETKVKVSIGGELFIATGLIIEDLGYMHGKYSRKCFRSSLYLVYPWDKWTDKNLPNYQLNQHLPEFTVSLIAGRTMPPPLLNEADLIALMDKVTFLRVFANYMGMGNIFVV